MFFAHYGKRGIYSHAGSRLHTITGKRQNHFIYIFVIPAKGPVQNIAFLLTAYRNFFIRNLKVAKVNKIHIKPFAVRILAGIKVFAFFVRNNFFLQGIYKQNASRLKARFDFYIFFRDIKNSNLAG